jgi:hypothetical protein
MHVVLHVVLVAYIVISVSSVISLTTLLDGWKAEQLSNNDGMQVHLLLTICIQSTFQNNLNYNDHNCTLLNKLHTHLHLHLPMPMPLNYTYHYPINTFYPTLECKHVCVTWDEKTGVVLALPLSKRDTNPNLLFLSSSSSLHSSLH